MAALWSQPAEVRLREICRARQADYGAAIRRLETQSAPDADRRCRPPRQVVFRPEGSAPGSSPKRRRNAPSHDRASDAEVAKLKFSPALARRAEEGRIAIKNQQS